MIFFSISDTFLPPWRFPATLPTLPTSIQWTTASRAGQGLTDSQQWVMFEFPALFSFLLFFFYLFLLMTTNDLSICDLSAHFSFMLGKSLFSSRAGPITFTMMAIFYFRLSRQFCPHICNKNENLLIRGRQVLA